MASRYITTTLPYVNADPHIGFALEIVHADIVARYYGGVGDTVFFNTGTDEHGQKIFDKARESHRDPQQYVDEYAAKFKRLKETLGLFDSITFIRTTDSRHKAAAQEFWRRCAAAGDIYKKFYEVKYCVGCELEKTVSELEHGRCPIHPNLLLEMRKEENYFFRLSAYRERLRAYYTAHPDFMVPGFRLEEAERLVADDGLDDFSISRLASKMPWGVSVPDDPEHVMYVWFDALVNYISTLGWPDPSASDTFLHFWGTVDMPNAVQFAGKDQVKQQAVMWQGMLMSAGLPPSKTIAIHGFITSGGQKMSKSLGNVIDPRVLVEEYGTDALRYYLARHIHPFEDSDFTVEKFHEAYTAHLVNGIGNLTSRVMKMATQYLDGPVDVSDLNTMDEIGVFIEKFEINRAMDLLWMHITELDTAIQREKPFEVIKKDPERAKHFLTHRLVMGLARIATNLKPFMPETSAKILDTIRAHTMPEPLFPRK